MTKKTKQMMKKMTAAFALCALLSGIAVTPAHAVEKGEHVTLYLGKSVANVNGSERAIPAAPKISAGRTFVPLRATAEAFGCDVHYEPLHQRIRINQGDRTIKMGINCTLYLVDDQSQFMDVAPYLTEESVTMVPVRFISEAIGFQVESKMEKGLTTEVHFTR